MRRAPTWLAVLILMALVLLPGGCASQKANVQPADAAEADAAAPAEAPEKAEKAEDAPKAEASEAPEPDDDPFADDNGPAIAPMADPIEPVNRAIYWFNDKMYFYVLKPVAQGYAFVVPERGRIWVRNFFLNLNSPVRFINCLLQGDFKGSGTELTRFVVNSTVGVLGFGDPAKHWFGIDRRNEDLGQTLGVWGFGHGFYIHLPFLGPSSLRDTIGRVGDYFMEPLTWIPMAWPITAGVRVFDRVNDVSLQLGEYEELKDAALDPYLAVRDAYNQLRRQQVLIRSHPDSEELEEDEDDVTRAKPPEEE